MVCWACQSEVEPHIERCPYCGVTVDVQAADPWVGRQLGVYQLVRRIGQGGMGVVYEAYHPHLQTSYALKALHPSLSEDWVMVERLRREAIVAFQLQHQNMVQVLDYGWDDGLGFYLVMELLRGEGLHTLLVRQPVLPLLRVAHIVYQICDALTLAHGCGVIHRDLKPGNVFLIKDLENQEQVKLLDFGIARWLDNQGQYELTRAGKSFGTPEYMPPEQILSRSEDICPATDIYALAAMTYRMLTGVLPFKGNTMIDTLNQVMTTPAPLVSRIRPGLAGTALELLLVRCMSKQPEQRVQSASDFAKQFQHALIEPKLRDFLRHDEAEKIVVQHQHENALAIETVGLDFLEEDGFRMVEVGHVLQESTFVLDQQTRDAVGVLLPVANQKGRSSLPHALSHESEDVGGLETMNLEEAKEWLEQLKQDAPTLIKGQSMSESWRESVAHIISAALPPSDHTVKLSQPPNGLREYTPPGRHILQQALSVSMPNSVPMPSSPVPRKKTSQSAKAGKAGSVVLDAEKQEKRRMPGMGKILSLWSGWGKPNKHPWWSTGVKVLGGFFFGFVVVGVVLLWRQISRSSEISTPSTTEMQVFSNDFQSGLVSDFYYLRIESEPSQARVIEQGKLLGLTPLTIRRKRGKILNFVLEKPGYELLAGSWSARHDQRVNQVLQARSQGAN